MNIIILIDYRIIVLTSLIVLVIVGVIDPSLFEYLIKVLGEIFRTVMP
jgi:hypothetical protein